MINIACLRVLFLFRMNWFLSVFFSHVIRMSAPLLCVTCSTNQQLNYNLILKSVWFVLQPKLKGIRRGKIKKN